MTYRFLESIKTNALLFTALGWLIDVNTAAKNIYLPIGENLPFWKECRVGLLKRVGETAAQNKATENCEPAHEGEEPEPTRLASNTTPEFTVSSNYLSN